LPQRDVTFGYTQATKIKKKTRKSEIKQILANTITVRSSSVQFKTVKP